MTGIAAGAAALTGATLGWWGAASVAIAAVPVAVWRRSLPVSVACALAIAVAAAGAWRAESPSAATPLAPGSVGMAVVVSAPVRSGQFQHFVVEPARREPIDVATTSLRTCVTGEPLPVVRFGDTLQIAGAVHAAADAALGPRAALATRGCSASLFAVSVRILDTNTSPARTLADVRSRLGAVLQGSAPCDAGALLTGFVTGDDAAISPERQRAVIHTGTSHLTAVSGSNLALVAGMLATIGAATVGRHRLTWQLVTVAAVWGYALVSGAQPPAVRAALVASAAVLAFRFGRRPDFPTLILLAAGTMALLDPAQIERLGFQLSVAASLALAVVLPRLMEHGRFSAGAAVVAAAAAAQLATLPFLLATFGTISLVSLPANILAAPLVAVAMPLALLAGVTGLVWMPLAEVIAAPAALAAEAMLLVIDVLGRADGYVSVGVPPAPAAAVISITVIAVILTINGDAARGTARARDAAATAAAAYGHRWGRPSARPWS